MFVNKNYIIEPYQGADTSKTYTLNSPVHGLSIMNFDDTNSLIFTVNGLNLTLKPQQQFKDNFDNPFTTVTVTNPSGCAFLIGGMNNA